MNLEPAPRLNKTPFIAVAAVCFIAVVLIGLFAEQKFAPYIFLTAFALLIISIVAVMIPILIDYAADSAEYVQQEREKVAEQVQRLHAAGESLMRAAAQIKAVEEAAAKTAHAAETLPYRMQEKLAEFNQQLTQNDDDEKERLNEELTTLRQSESERLQAITDKIHKASADWAALEIATRKQLTTAQEAGSAKYDAQVSALTESLDAKIETATAALDTKLATVVSTLDARMNTVMAALDAKLATFATAIATANLPVAAAAAPLPEAAPEPKRNRSEKKRPEPTPVEEVAPEPAPEPVVEAVVEAKPEPTPEPEPVAIAPAPKPEVPAEPTPTPEPALELTTEVAPEPVNAEPEAAVATPEVEATPEPVTATPEPVPAPEPAAATEEAKPKKSRASRKSKPEDLLSEMSAEPVVESVAPASESAAPMAPDDFFEEPVSSVAVAQSSDNESGELFAEPVEKVEAAASSDGATRLLATAYIGIGNKLFIRGEGPGLSWDKGVAMQFVSIGKWGWASHEATEPFRAKLYKNDDLASLSGEVTLLPGKHVEVTALF